MSLNSQQHQNLVDRDSATQHLKKVSAQLFDQSMRLWAKRFQPSPTGTGVYDKRNQLIGMITKKFDHNACQHQNEYYVMTRILSDIV